MKINVVDSIMGSGKSSAAINFINESSDDVKFMYVTPYLTEVDRIIEQCPYKKFKQPDTRNRQGSKLYGLVTLLNRGDNIATTHTLFHLFNDEIIDLCYSQGYVLIMDEVTDVIQSYKIGKGDFEMLLKDYIYIDPDTKFVKWVEGKEYYEEDKKNKFINVKHLCDMECLVCYGDNNIMMWTFPVKIFKAFRSSYILTYLFEAQLQKYYYDFYHLEYNYLYVAGDNVSNYHFTETPVYHKKDVSSLITILDDNKLNMVGDDRYALSYSWYKRNLDNALVKKTLKNNTYNFFNNKVPKIPNKIKKDENDKTIHYNIWTTFNSNPYEREEKDKEKKKNLPTPRTLIAGKGYTKDFVSCNMRATNDYRHAMNVAYLVNIFLEPNIKKFFVSKGINVLEEEYALSEMLQFIWRSSIRDNKPILLYVPSMRMREILKSWIEKQRVTEDS